MPCLVLPRCVVDTRVARGLRCRPPRTVSTQFVHSCRREIDPRWSMSRAKGRYSRNNGQIVAAFEPGGSVRGWDKLLVVHKPRLALGGISSVAFVSSVEARIDSRAPSRRARRAISEGSSEYADCVWRSIP